ncbi:MAG: hypothetical protein ABMA64_00595 [Myxococcota bacterium]
MMVPIPLRARGVVAMLHPERAKGRLGIDVTTEFGIGGNGKLVLRIPGGLLGGPRVVEVDRGELNVTPIPDGLTVTGGPVSELVIRAHPASAVYRTWREDAPFGHGPEWANVGHGSVLALTLDPTDPRRPHRVAPVGRARATATVWRRDDGTLRLDTVHEVLDLAAQSIWAVAAVAPTGREASDDPEETRDYLVYTFRASPDAWGVGYRLLLGDAALPSAGTIPDAIVPGWFVGHFGGAPIDGPLAVRAGATLVLFDRELGAAGQCALDQARFTTTPRWMLLGPGLDLTGELPEPVGRWLAAGAQEDLELLERVGGPAAGPSRAAIRSGRLCLLGNPDLEVEIADLDPSRVVARSEREVTHLTVGEIELRGRPDAIARVRELVLSQGGRATLERADTDQLHAQWAALRVERWTWMMFAPVLVADHLLRGLEAHTADEGRRRAVSELVTVADHARAVRLRAGASVVALPHVWLDEDRWWREVVGARPRALHLGAVRAQVRASVDLLSFALAACDRAIGGLAPLLDARTAPQEPPPGSLLSAHRVHTPPGSPAMAKWVDLVQRDLSLRALVDRAGPGCREAWSLVSGAAALAALEAARAASARHRRDRAADGPLEPQVTRDALIERILLLRAARAVAVDGARATVGEILDRAGDVGGGPPTLVERVSGSLVRADR